MKPVRQTHFHNPHDPRAPKGNCMQAAVASIMELPLDAVPHFYEHCLEGLTESQRSDMRIWQEDRIDQFLDDHGWVRFGYGYAPDKFEFLQGDMLCLLSGMSPRGVNHVVLVWLEPNGKWSLEWDPHPSDGSVTDPNFVEFLLPKELVQDAA